MEQRIKPPTMMTVREIARTGLLSEHALRLMLKAGKLPVIYIGKKALINYDKLCAELQSLESDVSKQELPTWY
jgi:hypothetical protein